MTSTENRRDNVISEGWRTVYLLTWVGVFACLVTLTVSSRTIGRPMWWIGPASRPASPFLLLIPVALVVIPVLTAYREPRRAALVSTCSSVLVIICGLAGWSRTPAIATVIGVVGMAALMSSIACLVGSRKYR